jgi:hypothetical protein
MTRVWEQSEQKGSKLLLLLALADHAADDGFCWPGEKRLAEKIRMSERTVSRMVQALEKDGELYALRKSGEHNWYVVRIGMSDEDVIQVLSNRGFETPDNLSPPTNTTGGTDTCDGGLQTQLCHPNLHEPSSDNRQEEKSGLRPPCPSGSCETEIEEETISETETKEQDPHPQSGSPPSPSDMMTFEDPDQNQLIGDDGLGTYHVHLVTRTRGTRRTGLPRSLVRGGGHLPDPHRLPGHTWPPASDELPPAPEWTAADVQHHEMMEGVDLDVTCFQCEEPIPVRELRPAAGACPHCGCPVQIAGPTGTIFVRPPQKYRAGYKPRKEGPPTTVGKLIDDCPDPLVNVYIPPDKLGELQIRLAENMTAMLLALNWAVGKDMGRRSVAAALGAYQKFAEENPSRDLPRGTVEPETRVSESFARALEQAREKDNG